MARVGGSGVTGEAILTDRIFFPAHDVQPPPGFGKNLNERPHGERPTPRVSFYILYPEGAGGELPLPFDCLIRFVH